MEEKGGGSGGSGAFTTVKQLHLHQVVRFGTACMVLPHLQVEALQVNSVLLSIEERAADTLPPHTGSNLLQAAGENKGQAF